MSVITSFPRLEELDAEELLQRLVTQSESPDGVVADAKNRVAMAPIAAASVRIEDALLDEVVAAVEAACGRFGYPSPGPPEFDPSACDAAVGEALHRSLPPGVAMSYAEAADPRIWSAIALCRLAAYVRWRWLGRLGAARDRVRRPRHMIGRLWWRADRAFDPGAVGGDYVLLSLQEGLWNQLEERTLFFSEREMVKVVLRRACATPITRDQLSAAVLVLRARIATGNLHVLEQVERDALVDAAFAAARLARP
jgi:hypothetical protein